MSDNQNIDTTTNINETDTNKTSTDHSDDYEKICYVCRRPESKAGEMITMPEHPSSSEISPRLLPCSFS